MRLRYFVTLAAGWAVLHVPCALAGEGPLSKGAQRLGVAAILDGLPSATCGVTILDLRDGSTVFDRGGDRPLIPASNQKLLVMAAAIDALGPSFEFRTVLARSGSDLVVIGDGDPTIGDSRLSERAGVSRRQVFEGWASVLKGVGWTEIGGDLIVDESVFDDQWTHPRWMESDLTKWYAAPVGALNVNDNCIDITYRPGAQRGAPILWELEPPASIIEVVNRATTGGKGRPIISRPSQSFRYVLSGNCAKRGEFPPVPVPDPGLLFADALRGVFDLSGITIHGDTRRERVRRPNGDLPESIEVLAEHRTPLREVLGRIGKDSQNLFAECLIKRLGYEHMRKNSPTSAVGSWVTGATAVKAFLRRMSLGRDTAIVSDASGLSRDNRVTAAQLASLLARMHGHEHRQLFIDSLAVAGVDGSLRKRMRDIAGRVRGKTGTMRGVKTLSAYVEAAGGATYAVSILFNDIKGPTAPFKRAQDDICRLLAGPPE